MKLRITLSVTIALLVALSVYRMIHDPIMEVRAQNNNPCQQVTNAATAGQVLSASGAGQPPPCVWQAASSGPTGATGATGATGPSGPSGPAGTALSGVSSAIGGGALVAACASGTVAVTGALTSQVATASPVADITGGGTTAFSVWAWVSTAGTVTVNVCGTGTPTSTTYNVRVQ
jgi:hypothetical protein